MLSLIQKARPKSRESNQLYPHASNTTFLFLASLFRHLLIFYRGVSFFPPWGFFSYYRLLKCAGGDPQVFLAALSAYLKFLCTLCVYEANIRGFIKQDCWSSCSDEWLGLPQRAMTITFYGRIIIILSVAHLTANHESHVLRNPILPFKGRMTHVQNTHITHLYLAAP